MQFDKWGITVANQNMEWWKEHASQVHCLKIYDDSMENVCNCLFGCKTSLKEAFLKKCVWSPLKLWHWIDIFRPSMDGPFSFLYSSLSSVDISVEMWTGHACCNWLNWTNFVLTKLPSQITSSIQRQETWWHKIMKTFGQMCPMPSKWVDTNINWGYQECKQRGQNLWLCTASYEICQTKNKKQQSNYHIATREKHPSPWAIKLHGPARCWNNLWEESR